MAVLLSSVSLAQVQPTPGVIPIFSTLEPHEYDTINLATLGIQLNVPVRSKAGHIPFSFSLKGAAQIQYMTNINPPPNTPPHYFYGVPTLAGQENQIGVPKVQPAELFGTCGSAGVWVYYDASGTGHPTSIPPLEPPNCGTANSGGSYTTDGSGIYVFICYSCGSETSYAIDPNGNKIEFGYSSADVGDGFLDSNGNSIAASRSVNGSTVTTTYADTLVPSQTTLTATAVFTSGPTPQETDTWTDALGKSQPLVLTPASLPILTAFGCTNLDQTTAFNTNFPSTVLFPDNSTLSFGWETTFSNSADYTGRLASVTIPTGGKITYGYSGGSHGINCVDGTPATMTRTTPDGKWTYIHTAPSTYGGSPTTTQVTDPLGNNTVYTFVVAATDAGLASYGNPLETERQTYNGSAVPANLVQTVITCYNNTSSSPTNCNPSSLTMPILEKDVYTTYPNAPGYSAIKTAYDTYGRVSDVKTYDFGLVLVNEKAIQYGTGSPSSQSCTAITGATISQYIIGKPCSIALYDSQNNNAILSQTWNSYDAYGNLLQTWNLVSGSGASGTYLSKQYSYDSHGVVQTMTDVNGQVMNYTTTSCNNMFVTSQYPTNFANLTTSQTWDCNGGVVTSSTDANGQITHTDYYINSTTDPFYRPLRTRDELNYVTSLSYPTANQTESKFLFNNNSSVIDVLSTTDSIGRPVTEQLSQGPSSQSWDTRTHSFDGDGRLYQTSLPCVTTVKGNGCGASTEKQTYDALNRPLVHTGTGGDIITKTYPANDVVTTLTPAPSNENAKTVQKEYDGLGRLKSSCLISSASGSGLCNQSNGGTGFLTTYLYDGAGRLLQVMENAQVKSPQQVRSYTYDDLGRVTSEKNPESGTTHYYWDVAPPICWHNQGWPTPGDLGAREDNAGVYICYGYDGLHRLGGLATVPNGGPCTGFAYDSGTPPSGSGISVQNTAGRLVEAYTNNDCNGPANAVTDEWFSYDARGQMSDYYQKSLNSNGYYHLSASHWEDKQIKAVSGVGLPTITFGASDGSGLDGEGRVTKVTASSGTTPVTGVAYNNANNSEPVGSLLTVTLGAGDSQNFTYDKNTGRMLSYSASVGATPTTITGSPVWNPNGTLQQLNIVDGYNSADTQGCSYLYDDFVRVAGTTSIPGVNCVNGSTKVWNQTFSYDGFGNITKTTTGPGASWACAACYNTANNQYNNVLSAAIQYDSNGNLLNDTFHTYTWDQQDRVATIDSNTITYDAHGNKVEENVGGTIHEYVSAFGVNAQMTGQTENSTTVALPGGVQALYSGGTMKRFRYPDWEGTIRAESDPTARQFTESLAFAPFGERYALKGAPYNFDMFAGSPDQIVSDEYDFQARQQHGGQGRWISPDPVRGTGNKYVYADNNPLSKVDISGLYAVVVNGLEVGEYDGSLFFGYPFPKPESSPQVPTHTDGQTSSTPSSDNGSSPSTRTPASDQQAGANGAAKAGQGAKEAQNQSNNRTGYDTQNQAANAALDRANPNSIRINKEEAGLIYKDSDGHYHYTGPVVGSDAGSNPHDAKAPRDSTVVGDYHTHGDYSVMGPDGKAVRTHDPHRDDYNSDHFSGQDKTGIAHDATGKPEYRGYLGTPSGKFLIYNPTTGQEGPLQ